MKKIFYILISILITYSCGSNGPAGKSKGELVGIKGKKYFTEKPYGMVLVPGGSFIMGKSDDDLPSIQDAPTKTVTVRSFYMDETEITNSEYRQFVRWVRDSVIRTRLAEFASGIDDIEDAMYPFMYKSEKELLASEDDNNSDENVYNYNLNNNNKTLDWDIELVGIGPTYNNPKGTYDKSLWPHEDYAAVMDEFLLSKDEIFNEMKFAWNVEKFLFKNKFSNISGQNGYLAKIEEVKRKEIEQIYEQMQTDGGIDEVTQPGSVPTFVYYEKRDPNDPNSGFTDEIEKTVRVTESYLHEKWPSSKRSKFIKEVPVPIYPDTTVWMRDFNYSYNEPMHNDYFWHDAYNDYPVVGVTWHQAKAFCEWRTKTKNDYQKTKKKKSLVPEFRLPTEAEWEYAARGGLQGAMYPWGGPYTKNDRGCFMANFKPMRGDYAVDQALYTVEANAYDPNGYSLYNMSGNVSEWIDSSYEAEAYEFSSSINPSVNNTENKLKVVRGGSWKDVKYFLQVSSRDYEYASRARSYIGFRTVHDYLGADMTANAMTNSTTKKNNNKRSSIK
tara:strand:- start:6744 stop:8411 length:1668 start_codon:yes stop_codon:yes gene_type:complete